MDKWWPVNKSASFLKVLFVTAYLATSFGISEIYKPCLRSTSIGLCPASDTNFTSTEVREKDVQTLKTIAQLIETKNTSICSIPRDSQEYSLYPPECCSFPFTLFNQLHRKCVLNSINGTAGCFMKPKIWINCDPAQATNYEASEEIKTLVLTGAAYPVTTISNWIIFQRRETLTFNFHRPWFEYRDGFGNFTSTDFWLGLEKVYQLCRLGNCRLRIEIETERRDWFSEEADVFFLDDELGAYSLHHSPLQGDSGRLLAAYNPNGIANGMRFSTFDNDKDAKFNDNCALRWGGGWWYNNCFWFNLNGAYGADAFSANNGRDKLAASRMMLKVV